ncbi:unnamed protein product, partial [Larinioides sclopetarius]
WQDFSLWAHFQDFRALKAVGRKSASKRENRAAHHVNHAWNDTCVLFNHMHPSLCYQHNL